VALEWVRVEWHMQAALHNVVIAAEMLLFNMAE
jgi:hypothetical protein